MARFRRSYPAYTRSMSSAGIGGTWPAATSSSRYRSGGTIRFLAHSISEARSRRGTNLWGRGSAFASEAISGAFASRMSPTGAPACCGQRRESWARAAAWKVLASTPSTPSRASRAFNSPAAFSVKVTARICPGPNVPLSTW